MGAGGDAHKSRRADAVTARDCVWCVRVIQRDGTGVTAIAVERHRAMFAVVHQRGRRFYTMNQSCFRFSPRLIERDRALLKRLPILAGRDVTVPSRSMER